MKVADCTNNNGEGFKITAYDDRCKKYLDRFTCEICNEQVDWINGKLQEKHFRHRHGSYRQDCENYCGSISINRDIQPYEREGLPLYLINEFGTYSLMLGLYGLEESTIQEAESINLELEIDIDENYKISRKINRQYFAPQQMSFIKIDVIKQKYRLNFSKVNIPNEISKKWNLNVNGIGNSGAIFCSGSYGGKKVNSSTGLTVNEEYLLFTSNNMDNNPFYGILFEKIQQINFGWLRNYNIYRFTIKEINSETIEFVEKFDMDLQYSQPEVIPIWPPCTILEQELVYKGESNKYFILNTDNKKELEAYSHVLQEKMPSNSIDDGKCLIASFVESDEDDFISIGNLQNRFVFSIVKQRGTKYTKSPDIQIQIDAGKLMINTSTKIFVNYFKNDILLRSTIIKKEFTNDFEIKKDEKIDILYGLDVIRSIGIQLKEDVRREDTILDIELLDKIRRCKGKYIITPDNFKWIVLKQRKYQQSYKELQKYMKADQISIELINLLKIY